MTPYLYLIEKWIKMFIYNLNFPLDLHCLLWFLVCFKKCTPYAINISSVCTCLSLPIYVCHWEEHSVHRGLPRIGFVLLNESPLFLDRVSLSLCLKFTKCLDWLARKLKGSSYRSYFIDRFTGVDSRSLFIFRLFVFWFSFSLRVQNLSSCTLVTEPKSSLKY